MTMAELIYKIGLRTFKALYTVNFRLILFKDIDGSQWSFNDEDLRHRRSVFWMIFKTDAWEVNHDFP
jgi:hypothetical protein